MSRSNGDGSFVLEGDVCVSDDDDCSNGDVDWRDGDIVLSDDDLLSNDLMSDDGVSLEEDVVLDNDRPRPDPST